ncbi:GPP34 family phosphoprotein [Actinacidiphila paucisporea]|uniref:Golgi phosphoprotein 3 (GPP34) n=1 Tax=Actinacidiphila paucisporea TaxID=310782 RepID=A0A1M7G3M9_9ACTN|nr:GPP34 family phosphoprotein [Actinacidiphila paucisporea]SHM10547.1 Golgi phosphoprotein 3 (GPP34) [Actinacidiphila paucisporea]
MTTAQDLMIVAMDVESGRPVESGDLSLALAGAELVDLLDGGLASLDGDLIVPGVGATPGDRLLAEAEAALVRRLPYESVEDWLWRRGRALSAAYLAALEDGGLVTRGHRRLLPGRPGPAELVDSPARRAAAERWTSREPVLTLLAATLGIPAEAVEPAPAVADEEVVTVLATTGEAVMELDAVRQRRDIEQAAFDNVWRGE